LEVNVAAGLQTAPGNAVEHTPTSTACPAARLRGWLPHRRGPAVPTRLQRPARL